MKRIFYKVTLASLAALLLWQNGLAVWAPQVSRASGLRMVKAGKTIQSFRKTKASRPYPGSRVGGADRGDCPKTDLPMMAVMPVDQNITTKVSDVWASTLKERPILWVYMPYGKSSDPARNFKLQLNVFSGDAKDETLGESSIDLPKTPGIMPIYLPRTVKLAIGESYRWTLAATCVENKPVDIDAWIYRAATPKAMPESKPISLETANFYAEQGLWLDTLNIAIALMDQSDLTPEQFQGFLKKSLVDSAETPDLQQLTLEKIAKQNVLLERLN